MKIIGTVQSGTKKASKMLMISNYKNMIEEICRYIVYTGTLNLKVNDKALAYVKEKMKTASLIQGFVYKGVEYSKIRLIECYIKHKKAHILIHKHTFKNDIIEIISSCNLRQTYKLKDGDKIEITIKD